MYGPEVVILLMYRSHDMRHTGFTQVDGGQWDPRDRGVTTGGRDPTWKYCAPI